MKAQFQYTRTPNLYVKDGMYYYRRQMAGPIYHHLGMCEIRRSLKTRNLKEARLRCAYIDLNLKQILGRVEPMLSDNISPEAKEIARDYFKRELQSYLDEIELGPRHVSVTKNRRGFDPEWKASKVPKSIDAFKKMTISKKFSPDISYQIDQGFKDIGQEIPSRNSNEYIMLGTLICRAHVEVLRIYHAHLTGKYSETSPQDPLFKEQVEPNNIVSHVTEGITLRKAIECHKKYKKDEITLGTKEDYQRVYNWMLDWFGENKIFNTITRPDVRSFKDMLTMMPKNYSKLKGYKKLSLKAVMDKSKRDKKVKLNSLKTHQKYFSLVKAFFQWAVDDGYLINSPALNIKLAKNKLSCTDQKRLPFSTDQLYSLLHSPIFTGYASPSKRYMPGKTKKRLPDFWAWLLALFAGLRAKEIVLLHRRDILTVDNVLCLSVNNDHGNGIKSKASERTIPIHDKLIELGFIEWVNKVTGNKPNKLIFPTLLSLSKNDLSKRISKRTNNYLRDIKIKVPKLTFHSCRHSLTDELRNNNLEAYSIKKILGHTGGDVTSGYGTGASMKVLKKVINDCYQEVDIEHLKLMK